MAVDLTLRRSSSRFTPEWERDRFWTVIHQDIVVGTIVLPSGMPGTPDVWNWTIHMHAGRFAAGVRSAAATEGIASSRDACLPPFRQAFERYLDFIGPEGWAHHVEHMRRISP